MAKKQTRRSVSLSRNTYERLKAFCEATSVSMSEFVETRIGEHLGRPQHRKPAPALAPDVDEESSRNRAGGIFTF
jgi:hypothetical protein